MGRCEDCGHIHRGGGYCHEVCPLCIAEDEQDELELAGDEWEDETALFDADELGLDPEDDDERGENARHPH